MKTIYKYQLRVIDDIQEVTMPENSKIIYAANQAGFLTFWAEVQEDKIGAGVTRLFLVHGTGHPIHDNEVYVGSVIQPPFVWHIYEVRN